jgi:hypothetical protein
MGVNLKEVLLRIQESVVFLFDEDADAPVGTAFVVGFPVTDQTWIPLIVTAKHVVDGSRRVLARFNSKLPGAARLYEYDINSLRAAGDYWEHTDRGVDLAVFRTPHVPQMQFKLTPLEGIASEAMFQEEDIKVTDRVMFPSLLPQFFGERRNEPVMRDGSICLLTGEEIPLAFRSGRRRITTRQKLLLVDTRSILGVSGAPVYLWPGPRVRGTKFALGPVRPWLLGVMHGFYPAPPREVEVVETRTRSAFSENSGIAIAFPSWRLLEIISRPDLQHRLEELGANRGS